jgi:5'-3' exonuclease
MSFLDEIFEKQEKKEPKRIVIIDFSNLLHSTFHAQVRFDKTLSNEYEQFAMWRFLLLNQISSLKQKLQPDELVLAIDNSSWRKKEFKYYKAARILKREKQVNYNVEEFYKMSNQFIDEITKHFPYKVIKIKNAEADDVIAILTKHLSRQNKDVIIVSRDKDFKQLLTSDNISFFDPQDKKFKTINDTAEFMIEHILKGDKSDGIPNMLSDDNVFVNSDKRQKQITKKVREEVAEIGLEQYAIKYNLIDNFERNKKLITLSEDYIPEDIKVNTIFQYNEQKPKANYIEMVQFFKKYKLKTLIDKCDQFLM